MKDRVSYAQMLPPRPKWEFDEAVVFDCTAHLERMSDNSFSLILSRGKSELNLSLFAQGNRIYARVFENSLKVPVEGDEVQAEAAVDRAIKRWERKRKIARKNK